MGIALARDSPESSGRAIDNCRWRVDHIKLVEKCGPSGSRRQDVPGILCPDLHT